jgi:hypothetical protein
VPGRGGRVVPGNGELGPRVGGKMQSRLQIQVYTGVRKARSGLRKELRASADHGRYWRHPVSGK